jgi:hypothetical protein
MVQDTKIEMFYVDIDYYTKDLNVVEQNWYLEELDNFSLLRDLPQDYGIPMWF